jgi:hypothetical protein
MHLGAFQRRRQDTFPYVLIKILWYPGICSLLSSFSTCCVMALILGFVLKLGKFITKKMRDEWGMSAMGLEKCGDDRSLVRQ